MSTEQKPAEAPAAQPHHHKEKLETNALGETLITGWQKFKAGQLISYKWMAVILIAVVAIFLGIYILSEKASERSKLWIELENANTRSGLVEFAEKNPNTVAGHVAELDLARFLLGPEGIDKLPTSRDEAERKTAIENIEKSRELFTKLLDAFKDQPIMQVQCLVGLAKSEAAFIGLTKPGTLESMGSMEKLIEWLDKLAVAADGTPWGDEAKKMSDSIKGLGKTKEEFERVQRSLYTLSVLPGLGDGPKPPTNPFDPIPGLPGGDPKPPTPKAPEPPKKDAVTPKPPEPPKKDAVTPKPPEPPKKDAVTPKPPEPPKKDEGPKPPAKSPDPVPPPKPPEPPKK
jgi:hypothetical protein